MDATSPNKPARWGAQANERRLVKANGFPDGRLTFSASRNVLILNGILCRCLPATQSDDSIALNERAMNPFNLIRVACVCLVATFSPAQAGTNVVTRAVTSRHASFPASVTGGGDSVFPMLTPDGRYVAFMSNAGNLVTDDNNGADFDIFVRDRINRTTVLVSVAASGTGGGNGVSTLGGISTDGRYVVFESEASNLITGDTNRQSDVFIRDLQLGTTRLVSVTTNGVQGKGRSLAPLMSADGSKVLFETSAQNLTPGLPGYGFNLVLWDARDKSLQLLMSLLDRLQWPGYIELRHGND
jgi:hypothetical protein